MSNVRKALVAVAGVLGVVATVLADGQVTGDEGVTIGIAIVTAIGVYFAPNTQA